MLTENVYYSEKPDKVIIRTNGKRAIVEFPTKVSKAENGSYLAKCVYSLETMYTLNIEERVKANFDKWLEKAKEV